MLASDFGVELAGFRIAAPFQPDVLAAIAAGLDTPVLIAHGSVAERVAAANALRSRGVAVLVEASGSPESWLPALERVDADVAWQIDTSVTDMAGDLRNVLRTPVRLRYIRLLGGGPEAAMADGRGIGPLMGQLALNRFDGPLIVAPGSARYRMAWAAWLGRRGGWGCGSRTDPAVVQLAPATKEG
jgi:hypothetical protein